MLTIFSTFTGIGGFEIGIENALGPVEIVGYSEIDKYACSVYEHHFKGVKNYGDITKIDAEKLPDFDCLVGGFPCQAFSIAGNRRGFADTRGTLFFDLARILRSKQPRLFVFENVKGLVNHDGGKTFRTIIATIDELGYDCQWQVLNSKDFGVPQNRERVIIIGHIRGSTRPQVFPITGNNDKDTGSQQGQITGTVDTGIGKNHRQSGATYIKVVGNLNDEKWSRFNESSRRVYDPEGISPTVPTSAGGGHMPKILTGSPKYVNGKRQVEYNVSDKAPTIRATQYKSGDNQPKLIQPVMTPDRVNKKQNGRRMKPVGEPSHTLTATDKHGIYDGALIRRLTPLECERLQGFPDNWTAVEGMSDTQRYKMCGNAVTTNVVQAVFEKLA